ncbi:MAG: hypothetical protein U9M92_00655 [Patescibacteria group bacterium]|nr:hypothetical protein [Patescibacteria group bacterium]
MSQIKIIKQQETSKDWKLVVRVGDLDFTVTVDKDYWQKLTDGQEEVGDLVRRSFEFLLTREPKESILREFNLKKIEYYFPEYPKEIKKNL